MMFFIFFPHRAGVAEVAWVSRNFSYRLGLLWNPIQHHFLFLDTSHIYNIYKNLTGEPNLSCIHLVMIFSVVKFYWFMS